MLSLTIGGVNIGAKVTGYTEALTKVKDNDNSFISATGSRYNVYLANKYTLSVTAEGLTNNEKTSLITALSSGSFSVTFNGTTKTFFCENAPADLFYATNQNMWDCSFFIEEV